MKTRVALVACLNEHTTIWSNARGNESGIKIVHMVEGEHIKLEIQVGDLTDSAEFHEPGVFPLPWKRIERYRLSKIIRTGVSPAPTSVEMVLNGSSRDASGDLDDP